MIPSNSKIQEQQIDLLFGGDFDDAVTIPSRQGVVSVILQQGFNTIGEVFIVVRDKYRGFAAGHYQVLLRG